MSSDMRSVPDLKVTVLNSRELGMRESNQEYILTLIAGITLPAW